MFYELLILTITVSNGELFNKTFSTSLIIKPTILNDTKIVNDELEIS